FGDRAWLFVTGYLALQLGRVGFLIAALRGRSLGEHFVNDLAWELLAGGLWVAGAVGGGGARLALVGGAGGGDLAGARSRAGRGRRIDLGHTGIAGHHLLERFRLFFLIALGETVVTTGDAFTGQPFALSRLVALAIGFTGTVALFWCYFGRAEGAGVGAADA